MHADRSFACAALCPYNPTQMWAWHWGCMQAEKGMRVDAGKVGSPAVHQTLSLGPTVAGARALCFWSTSQVTKPPFRRCQGLRVAC